MTSRSTTAASQVPGSAPNVNKGDGLSGHLVPIDHSNWRSTLGVRVSDEQLPMVAEAQPVALSILAKAYLQPDGKRWEPLAYVDDDGGTVAVFALTHAGDVAEVRNFAVDLDRQGTGVGTTVMKAVFDWCRSNGSTSVELTFHPANEAASRLYTRVGFRPTGELRNGEAVLSFSLGQQAADG